MNEVIGSVGSSVEVSTYAPREQVVVEMEDGYSNVTIFITPGEAVRISRALVKAASEALGVKV